MGSSSRFSDQLDHKIAPPISDRTCSGSHFSAGSGRRSANFWHAVKASCASSDPDTFALPVTKASQKNSPDSLFLNSGQEKNTDGSGVPRSFQPRPHLVKDPGDLRETSCEHSSPSPRRPGAIPVHWTGFRQTLRIRGDRCPERAFEAKCHVTPIRQSASDVVDKGKNALALMAFTAVKTRPSKAIVGNGPDVGAIDRQLITHHHVTS